MPNRKPPRPTVHVSRTLEPIFAQFLEIQLRQRAALGQAMTAGDAATALRLAHSMKGAAATYELPDAAAIARDLEAALALGDLDLAKGCLEALTAHFNAIEVVFVDRTSLPEA